LRKKAGLTQKNESVAKKYIFILYFIGDMETAYYNQVGGFVVLYRHRPMELFSQGRRVR
jgi:hypothetical protein